MNETKNKEYQLNNYRIEKINNKFLITTDHGSWCFLNKEDFDLLIKEGFQEKPELFNVLEEKGIILTNENKDKIIKLLKDRFHFLFQGTSLHIIIPTLRCNQKCVYCHASSKPIDDKGEEMDEETAKKTVDFIFQSPSKTIIIEFQGGEPLIKFDIIKYIINYAKKLNKEKKKNLVFTVVTNLTLMNEDKMNYFIENSVGVCTSLDGPAELHNKNRPFMNNVESYKFTEKWIKRFTEEYKKKKIENRKMNALITITRESLKYPKEIIDKYVELGLKDIHLRFLNNLGDARPVWESINYSPEEFINFWKKSIDYLLEINKKNIFLRERTCFIILRKILTNIDPNFLDMRSPCGAAIGQLTYTPNGDIFTCDEARMVGEDIFKLGNTKKDTYKKILTSRQTCGIITSSINDSQICDSCAYKPYCGICPVCNYMEQGSIIVNILKTARCKIYKAQFTYLFEKLQHPEYKKIFVDWIKKSE
ncbi:His-Xaa-Ser system radical SAM maturase HxsB [archaeon]|nr:His-Xaa-Ser system radical SAM maturase HxsB [archaeon]